MPNKRFIYTNSLLLNSSIEEQFHQRIYQVLNTLTRGRAIHPLHGFENLYTVYAGYKERIIIEFYRKEENPRLLFIKVVAYLPNHEYGDLPSYIAEQRRGGEFLEFAINQEEPQVLALEKSNPSQRKTNQGNIATHTLLSATQENSYEEIYELMQTATNSSNRIILNGIAGSGKTLIALQLMLRFHEEQVTTPALQDASTANCIYLTENIKLVEQQKQNLIAMHGSRLAAKHIRLMSFDEFCVKHKIFPPKIEQIAKDSHFYQWLKEYFEEFSKQKSKLSPAVASYMSQIKENKLQQQLLLEEFKDILTANEASKIRYLIEANKFSSTVANTEVKEKVYQLFVHYQEYLAKNNIANFSYFIKFAEAVEKIAGRIFIDESQKLPSLVFKQLCGVSDENQHTNTNIVLLADANQASTTFSLDQFLKSLKVRPRCFYLTEVFRCHEKIVNFANHVLRLKNQAWGGTIDSKAISIGDLPQVAEDKQQPLELLAQKSPRTSGMVKFVHCNTSKADSIFKDQAILAKTAFIVFNPEAKEILKNLLGINCNPEVKLEETCIILDPSNIHGLEFDNVVLINPFAAYADEWGQMSSIHEQQANKRGSSKNLPKDKELAQQNMHLLSLGKILFTAATRAKNNLTIFDEINFKIFKKLSSLFEIDAIEGIEKFSLSDSDSDDSLLLSKEHWQKSIYKLFTEGHFSNAMGLFRTHILATKNTDLRKNIERLILEAGNSLSFELFINICNIETKEQLTDFINTLRDSYLDEAFSLYSEQNLEKTLQLLNSHVFNKQDKKLITDIREILKNNNDFDYTTFKQLCDCKEYPQLDKIKEQWIKMIFALYQENNLDAVTKMLKRLFPYTELNNLRENIICILITNKTLSMEQLQNILSVKNLDEFYEKYENYKKVINKAHVKMEALLHKNIRSALTEKELTTIPKNELDKYCMSIVDMIKKGTSFDQFSDEQLKICVYLHLANIYLDKYHDVRSGNHDNHRLQNVMYYIKDVCECIQDILQTLENCPDIFKEDPNLKIFTSMFKRNLSKLILESCDSTDSKEQQLQISSMILKIYAVLVGCPLYTSHSVKLAFYEKNNIAISIIYNCIEKYATEIGIEIKKIKHDFVRVFSAIQGMTSGIDENTDIIAGVKHQSSCASYTPLLDSLPTSMENHFTLQANKKMQLLKK